MIIDSEVDSFSLFSFQALPGTPVFHTLVENGAIPVSYTQTSGSVQNVNKNYTTIGLKNVNITMFKVMTFLLVFLRRPLKIIRLLDYHRFSVILKQLAGMLRST
jgi:hypothetical protein